MNLRQTPFYRGSSINCTLYSMIKLQLHTWRQMSLFSQLTWQKKLLMGVRWPLVQYYSGSVLVQNWSFPISFYIHKLSLIISNADHDRKKSHGTTSKLILVPNVSSWHQRKLPSKQNSSMNVDKKLTTKSTWTHTSFCLAAHPLNLS